MHQPTRTVPIILDPIELHLRTPVKRPDALRLTEGGLSISLLRIL